MVPVPFQETTSNPMWQKTADNKLHRSFEFRDFSTAFAFMVRVALLAEVHNHHPQWTNEWNKVDIWLCTHDAGHIVTEKDRKLAAAIDRLLDEVGSL